MKLTKILILFLILSLKGYSQQNPTESKNPKFTLKYSTNQFCYGSVGELKPTLTYNDGKIIEGKILNDVIISFSRILGQGKLDINTKGEINQSKSDIGEYLVIVKFGNYSSSINFKVKKCD
jgi:hypothetical protein